MSCFMELASCGSMGSLLRNSLWLIAVDPHRGGSISLRPLAAHPSSVVECGSNRSATPARAHDAVTWAYRRWVARQRCTTWAVACTAPTDGGIIPGKLVFSRG